MSSEPKSTIQGPQDLEDLRSLADIPPSVHLLLAGEIWPDACPEGFFIIYEYPFKIGFWWSYSPLAKASMSYFKVSPE